MLERIDGTMADEELVVVANAALESGDFSKFSEVPFYAVPLAVIALDMKDLCGPQVKRFEHEGERFLALCCDKGYFRLHQAEML